MSESQSLLSQTNLHYPILEILGGSGMGAIYKAEDARLRRFVALKFLPQDVVCDAQALARFQRKARAASAVESFSFFEQSLESSRRFRALNLWFSLRYHGLEAFREPSTKTWSKREGYRNGLLPRSSAWIKEHGPR